MALLNEFSIQLYTLRNEIEADGFASVLNRLGEMGYTGVEFAGYGDVPAAEMAQMLKDANLTATGSHIMLQRFEQDLAGEIAYAKALGMDNVVIPYYELEKAADVPVLAAEIAKLAPALREAGLQLGYHNHFHEFKTDESGAYLLDLLLEAVPAGDLFLELDLYWAAYADVDIPAYLQKHTGRIKLVHIKQMKDRETKACVNLDEGMLEFASLIATAKDIGAERFILEQEANGDASMWEGAQKGVDYIYSL